MNKFDLKHLMKLSPLEMTEYGLQDILNGYVDETITRNSLIKHIDFIGLRDTSFKELIVFIDLVLETKRSTIKSIDVKEKKIEFKN